jgi:hypothetical protein
MTLTEAQHVAVCRAINPLDRNQQDAFLAALEIMLAERTSVGDGELFRMLRELQRIHLAAYPERTSERPQYLRGRP